MDVFPNAKFILMSRDGRATAHSIYQRQVGIGAMDITAGFITLTDLGLLKFLILF